MMMKTLRTIGISLLLLAGAMQSASAQGNFQFGGEVMQQAGLSPDHMARLSQTQPFGTARSMAMGGAFTSLGGDMASLFVNPAGLGMYRSNEFSFTPLVTIVKSESPMADYAGNNESRFALANIGFVFNVYESTGRLVSVNMGFAYNRVADLNCHTSFRYDTPPTDGMAAPSLLRAFAGQLTASNRYPNSEGFLGYYGMSAPDLWGAMMAYNAYLLNPYEDALGPYWEADHVGHNATVGHFYDLESRGSIGEYAFSLGMNINNKIYVGATFGVQSLSQRVNLYYGEDYRYLNGQGETTAAVNAAGQELIEQADYMHYNQYARIDGAGFDLKLGLVFRPVEAVRIGVAYHSPTWFSIDQTYGGQMASMAYNNDDQKYYPSDVNSDGTWSDSGADSWELTTPSRLLFGLSYTFGKRAILSVDYQRDWYNAIRVENTPFWAASREIYTDGAMKQRFAATNTVRVGGEFKATQRFALRAGFGYTTSMAADRNLVRSNPLAERIITASAGLGLLLSRTVSLDIAYQYSAVRNTDYRLFYGAELLADGSLSLLDASEPITTDYARHNVAMTMNFKF